MEKEKEIIVRNYLGPTNMQPHHTNIACIKPYIYISVQKLILIRKNRLVQETHQMLSGRLVWTGRILSQ